jgi:capsular exopolysaccharide synthesis family protein
MLRSRLTLIVIVGAAAGLAVATALLLQPKRYEATALVVIDPRGPQVVSPERSLSTAALSAAAIDTEVAALNTRDMAARLVERLNLRQDPEFNPAAANPAAEPPARDRVPNRVAGAIEARRKGPTNVIEVTASSADPDKAALLANEMARTYLAWVQQIEAESSAEADSWLSRRLGELRADVVAKERAADTFRAEAGLVATQGSTLSERQTSQVQEAMLAAEADLAEAQARQQQVTGLLARGAAPDGIAEVVNSNVIRDLRGREADVARQRAELLAQYGPRHPDVLNNAAELADIRAQLRAATRRVTESLRSEVEVAQARVANLQEKLSQSESALLSGSAQQVQLRQMEREAAAARAVYEAFLERSHEISHQAGLSGHRARLLSQAAPPAQDTAPPLWLIALAAALCAAIAGLLAALLAEQIDDRLRSADDLERKTGVSALASVPQLRPRALRALPPDAAHPAQYLLQNPLSGFAESMRVVRAWLLYTQSIKGSRVIAISSAAAGEGKTTLSLSLARVAALCGERVVLVDCDIRRREVNHLLHMEPSVGLIEVLAGSTSWRDAIGRDEETSAHILPLSTLATPLEDHVGSVAMQRTLKELAQSYDLVILDCPPVLAVAETRVLARLADMVLLVARWRSTTARSLANAIHQLRASGAEVGGVVLNRVDPRAPGRTSYAEALYFQQAGRAYYNA